MGDRRRALSFVTSQPRWRGPEAKLGMSCAQLGSRAAAEACARVSSLSAALDRTSPAARSQSLERKKKRGGGGAADSSVPPSPQSSCGETAALLLAAWGCAGRREGGRAPPNGSGRRVPVGRRGRGEGLDACSFARSPDLRALSFLKCGKVFGDSRENTGTCRERGRLRVGSERRGAAGEGVGYLLWRPARGLCAGGGPHRADKKRFPRKAEITDTPEKRRGAPMGV